MRTPRIFTRHELSTGAMLELEPAASAHIARAMRMQAGDVLTLFNGQGGEYTATIIAVGKKMVTVELGSHRDSCVESALEIHLGIAISRGDRMDWIVQKATELGVNCVTPLLTERTEVKLKGERAEKKIRHWQQISIAACEQSGRNTIPQIAPLQPLSQWLDTSQADGKFVLHHRALMESSGVEQPKSIALLIGPEGGLSPWEIALAEAAHYQALKLGPRVLRTETAPLAAISILQAKWGDMAPS